MHIHSAGKMAAVDTSVHKMGNVGLYMIYDGYVVDGLSSNT